MVTLLNLGVPPCDILKPLAAGALDTRSEERRVGRVCRPPGRSVDCNTTEVAAGEMISHEVVGRDRAQRDCVACHSASSTLKTRLYRHLAKEEQQRLGFANSVILATSYVPGATRHPLLDTLVLGAFAAMILGLLAHGLGRFLTRGKRRSEPAPTTEKNDPGTGTNGGSHG